MSKGTKRPISEVLPTTVELAERCKQHGWKVQVCGSIRRQCAMIGDIDIIAHEEESPHTGIRSIGEVLDVVQKGKDKTIIGLYKGLKVNFFWIPPESWGAGMLFATGNADFNQRCRAIAKTRGMKLNRYGLHDHTGRLLESKSEIEILKSLGLPFIRPKDRDGEQKRDEDPDDIEVRSFNSSSSDKVYTTTFNKSAGTGECTCPGFRFRGHCKHIDILRRSV